MRIPRIEIKNAIDYGDWATDVLSEMTKSIINDTRYCRPITDDDIEEGADPFWSFVFTDRSSKMVDAWKDRLVRLGEAMFPEEEIDVQNWHYDEP